MLLAKYATISTYSALYPCIEHIITCIQYVGPRVLAHFTPLWPSVWRLLVFTLQITYCEEIELPRAEAFMWHIQMFHDRHWQWPWVCDRRSLTVSDFLATWCMYTMLLHVSVEFVTQRRLNIMLANNAYIHSRFLHIVQYNKVRLWFTQHYGEVRTFCVVFKLCVGFWLNSRSLEIMHQDTTLDGTVRHKQKHVEKSADIACRVVRID